VEERTNTERNAISSAPVISNASPLIALEQIGYLDLLNGLFSAVLIPPAFVPEVAPTVKLPTWVSKDALTQPIGPQMLPTALGPRESEAISLALEISAQWVILDEQPARRLAQAMGLPVIGMLGILLASKRRGLLTAVRPCMDPLVNLGFHISPGLYDLVLADAGDDR
jgi:predicted nucleic acid-binding protein